MLKNSTARGWHLRLVMNILRRWLENFVTSYKSCRCVCVAFWLVKPQPCGDNSYDIEQLSCLHLPFIIMFSAAIRWHSKLFFRLCRVSQRSPVEIWRLLKWNVSQAWCHPAVSKHWSSTQCWVIVLTSCHLWRCLIAETLLDSSREQRSANDARLTPHCSSSSAYRYSSVLLIVGFLFVWLYSAICSCVLVVLLKLSVLAKWLAIERPLWWHLHEVRRLSPQSPHGRACLCVFFFRLVCLCCYVFPRPYTI